MCKILFQKLAKKVNSDNILATGHLDKTSGGNILATRRLGQRQTRHKCQMNKSVKRIMYCDILGGSCCPQVKSATDPVVHSARVCSIIGRHRNFRGIRKPTSNKLYSSVYWFDQPCVALDLTTSGSMWKKRHVLET